MSRIRCWDQRPRLILEVPAFDFLVGLFIFLFPLIFSSKAAKFTFRRGIIPIPLSAPVLESHERSPSIKNTSGLLDPDPVQVELLAKVEFAL